MRRYLTFEVLTSSFLGVPWLPWLFALQEFEVQDKSMSDGRGERIDGRL